MPIVDLSHIVKSFGPMKAMDDVSFSLLLAAGLLAATAVSILLDGAGRFRAQAQLSGQAFKRKTCLWSLPGRL
jgi:hypothetical protein